MGFTEEDIKEELAQEEPIYFEVWPEHADALQAFLGVQHQWNYPPMGGKPVGLNYSALQSEIELTFPKKYRREIYKQVQQIERGALDAWHTKT